ncbi:MAG: glycosyltransferase [Candidatus Eisenbacteria bacterium]
MLGYVLKVYPPAPSETFITNEILELGKLGVPFRVFALKQGDLGASTSPSALPPALPESITLVDRSAGGYVRIALAAGEAFLRKPGRFLYLAFKNLLRCDTGSFKDFLLGARLSVLVRRRGISHLHAHYATASAQVARYARLLSGVSYSFTGHALDIFVGDGKLENVVNDASFVVTVCDYNKQFLLRKFKSLSEDRVKLVLCGVDAQRFERRALPRAGRPFVFVSVGRFVEKKGFGYLVKACEKIRRRGHSFECLLVGDGPLLGGLREEIRALGLEDTVSLLGTLPPDKVRGLLETSNAFVLPCVVASDGDRDSMPVVVKEAMAMELPIIASREVGIPEMLADGCGVMVPPRDVKSLSDAMELFLTTRPEVLAEMGARGRRLVLERFTVGGEVRKLEKLFRQYVR